MKIRSALRRQRQCIDKESQHRYRPTGGTRGAAKHECEQALQVGDALAGTEGS
ncbi:MAG: hypothetical protein MK319_08105 [Pseudomonadales bacterium]|nr:hypothetical protein [Pseudomonadales bacterium]